MALNKSDEAIEMLKRIISAHFRKSNDLKMDGGMTVISEYERRKKYNFAINFNALEVLWGRVIFYQSFWEI